MAITGTTITKASTSASERLPRKAAPPTPEFRIACLPTRWNWDVDTGEWFPALNPVSWQAGVNGGRAPRGRAFQDDGPRSVIRKKGGVIVEPFDPRLKRAGFDGYVRQFTNDAGQRVHTSIFESFEVVGNKAYRMRDEEGVREFCRVLLKEGIVPAMSEHVLRDELDKIDARIARMINRLGSNPAHGGVATKLETMQARRYGMEHCVPLVKAVDILRGDAVEVDEPAPAATAPKTAPRPRARSRK